MSWQRRPDRLRYSNSLKVPAPQGAAVFCGLEPSTVLMKLFQLHAHTCCMHCHQRVCKKLRSYYMQKPHAFELQLAATLTSGRLAFLTSTCSLVCKYVGHTIRQMQESTSNFRQNHNKQTVAALASMFTVRYHVKLPCCPCRPT